MPHDANPQEEKLMRKRMRLLSMIAVVFCMGVLPVHPGTHTISGTFTNYTGDTLSYVEVKLKSGKIWGVEGDLVVYATGVRAQGQESENSGPAMKVTAKSGPIPAMSMKAEEVHVIGDCCGVARILEAIRL